jgi:serine/threonine protein kinase
MGTDRPRAPPSDTVRAGPPDVPPAFASGDVVAGQYEIRALLGSGGMGQVYEAHDRELNRRVAIKVLAGAIDSAHLRREGQALAAIRHPSIVTVHTLGTHASARGAVPFLVMERVYGMSLEAMLEQRRRRGERLPIAEAIDLAIQIAEGLAAVHSAGVSHRDVKPANVMLAPSGRVVLMDFGLMLPDVDAGTDAPSEVSLHPDDAGTVAGSLEYMAPEALASNVAPGRGHLVDVYALGVVLFQLFTGILPYGASDARSLARAQRRAVPRASAQRRDVPQAACDLARAMMARDPSERPQSAELLLWSLRRVRDTLDRSTPAPPFAVLVVDDSPATWETLSLYVRAIVPDAEITTAKGGEEALRALRKRVPNVLFLDLVLADMNGVEVCMYVGGLPGGDRCLIISTGPHASQADVNLLDQLGVRFIAKGKDRMAAIVALLEHVKPP